MSLGHGASVARDGLVFYYDTSNIQKSWKGRPTTNLLAQPLSLQTGYETESWTGSITDNAEIAPDGTRTATRITRTAGYFYKRNTIAPTFTITPGETITFSCWVKKLDATNQTGRGIYVWCYNGAGSGNRATASQSLSNSTWVRQSVTYTALTGETSFAFGFVGDAASHLQGSIAVWRPMVEISSFATPFTTGTRSSTQAILDLTNNNTVNAVSLTYNSNNTFSFDGTNNYIDCGNSAILDIKRTISLECWFRLSSLSFASSWSNLISKMDSIGNTPTRSYSAFINTAGYIHFCTADTTGQEVLNSTSFIQLNTWYHWVGTIDRYTGSIKQYVNGVENVSGTIRATDTITNSEPVCINFRGSSVYNRFPGNVDNVKIYNRVLTPIEVRRNFEASRARFGI